MLTAFILRFENLPPQMPFFYSRPWGEEQLADWWMIFILPLTANFFGFLNGFIQKKFFIDNQLVVKIIYYLNLFLITSTSLIFVKIIFFIT